MGKKLSISKEISIIKNVQGLEGVYFDLKKIAQVANTLEINHPQLKIIVAQLGKLLNEIHYDVCIAANLLIDTKSCKTEKQINNVIYKYVKRYKHFDALSISNLAAQIANGYNVMSAHQLDLADTVDAESVFLDNEDQQDYLTIENNFQSLLKEFISFHTELDVMLARRLDKNDHQLGNEVSNG